MPPTSRRRLLQAGVALSLPSVATSALAAPQSADLIITGAYVHTMNAARELYRDGAVAIRGDRIVGVGPSAQVLQAFRGRKMDGRGKLVLPGFFDNHLHPALVAPVVRPGAVGAAATYPGEEGAFDRRPPGPLMPGGDFEANFAWLLPLTRDGYTEEETYYFALAALMGGAAGGMTCYVDGGAGVTETLVRAQLDVGLRGAVTRAAYDRLVDPRDRAAGMRRVLDTDMLLAEAERQHKALHGLGDGLVHHWFGAFLDANASDELLSGMATLARTHGTGLWSHTAAAVGHDAYSLKHHGRATFDRLEQLGVLGPNWLGVHMGAVAEADVPRLKAAGCKVTHCPGTSMFGGKGFISRTRVIPGLITAGVPVSLGSDTANRGVVLVEAQRAFAAHKDAWQDNRVLPAYTVMRMLTSAGAACALRPECGSLEPGKKADLTLVDIDNPRFEGADPLLALLYVGYPTDVTATMVDGRFVYRDREFPTLDADKVKAEVRRLASARLGRQPPRPR